jgi:hypothetical protein
MIFPEGTIFSAKDHFKAGDLVYGRATTRADLSGPIRREKVVQFSEAVMCDDMNNCFVGTGADDGPDAKRVYGVFNQAIGHQAHMPSGEALKNFLLTSQYRQGKMDISKTPTAADQMLRIKRACKGGIMMTAERKRIIHFYIRDIDMKQVAGKNIFPAGDQRGTFDPITSKELRFVYRKWTDPSMNLSNSVQFWNKSAAGQIVAVKAPWEEDPKLWTDNYK